MKGRHYGEAREKIRIERVRSGFIFSQAFLLVMRLVPTIQGPISRVDLSMNYNLVRHVVCLTARGEILKAI